MRGVHRRESLAHPSLCFEIGSEVNGTGCRWGGAAGGAMQLSREGDVGGPQLGAFYVERLPLLKNFSCTERWLRGAERSSVRYCW